MAKKKVEKLSQEEIAKQLGCKHYSVAVIAPKGYPDAQEGLSHMFYTYSGALFLAEAFGKSFLNAEENKADLCRVILAELDKNDSGMFSAEYYMDCDKRIGQHGVFVDFKKQLVADVKKLDKELVVTEEIVKKQFGVVMRELHRKIIFRFFGYYTMGYTVKITEIVSE